MNKPLKTLKTLIVSGLILVPCTAFSQAAQQSRVVHIGDLDPSTPAGAQALYQRISRVAQRVCDQGGPVNLATGVAEAKCRQKAIDDAVRQLNRPQLTALHLQPSGWQSARR